MRPLELTRHRPDTETRATGQVDTGLSRRHVLTGLAIVLTATLVPLRWLGRRRNGWLLKREDLL